jgi:hypothetical protein
VYGITNETKIMHEAEIENKRRLMKEKNDKNM